MSGYFIFCDVELGRLLNCILNIRSRLPLERFLMISYVKDVDEEWMQYGPRAIQMGMHYSSGYLSRDDVWCSQLFKICLQFPNHSSLLLHRHCVHLEVIKNDVVRFCGNLFVNVSRMSGC